MNKEHPPQSEEEPPLYASTRTRWDSGHSIHVVRHLRGRETCARRLCEFYPYHNCSRNSFMELLQALYVVN